MHMPRDRGLVVEHELAMSRRRDFERKYGESFHREDLLINKCKKDTPNDGVCPVSVGGRACRAWWSRETVAVVTGANRGIGHALAARLADHGLAVVLTARDGERGEAAVAPLRDRGLPVVFRCLDVSDAASVAGSTSWCCHPLNGLRHSRLTLSTVLLPLGLPLTLSLLQPLLQRLVNDPIMILTLKSLIRSGVAGQQAMS